MKLPFKKTWTVFLILLALTFSAIGVTPAYAATFTINNPSDVVDDNIGNGVCHTAGGVCTLRAAIQEANATGGDDTITVPAGTYTLTIAGTGEDAAATGDLDITSNITVNGAGAGSTIIQAYTTPGSGIDRVFQVTGAFTVNISDITIANGKCTSCNGGGIFNDGGTLTITNSIFSGNSADSYFGGGIYNNGTLTVTNSTFSGNPAGYGGGIANDNSRTLTVTNSTFSDNPAGANGGGILNGGMLTVTNSTFSGNYAPGSGGGIFNGSGTLSVTNSTFSNNSAEFGNGGGIYNQATLHLKNTILANSTFGGDCYNNSGDTIDTNINNLIVTNGPSGNMCGTPTVTTDPSLVALADNGGPTQTFAITDTSSAYNAGDNATCAATDQRGVSRPQGAGCDIGAFEVDSTAPTALSFVRQTPSNSSTNADTLVFRATFSEAVIGVDTADFAIHGTSTATVTGASPISASVYDVTVFGGNLASFNGMVGLDFSSSPSITDLATNAFVNAEPAIDQTYTLDNTPPTVVMTSLASDPTHTSPIAVTVTFSESVTGFDSGDISASNGMVGNFTVVNGTTYTFDLTPTANGLVTADIAAGVATDLAGNGNTIAAQFSRTYITVYKLFLPLILR